MRQISLAAMSAVLLATTASAQTTWYVDVNATPPGNGSQASPFTTIQVALSNGALQSGDTVLVAPGVYDEQILFPLGKSMTLRSQSGPAVTRIEPNAPATNIYVVVEQVTPLPPATIEGFTISGERVASSIGVRSAGLLVRHCVVTGHKRFATFSPFSGSGLLSEWDLFAENCIVSGNVCGTTLGQAGVTDLRNSIIQGNTFWDIDPSTPVTVSQTHYTLNGTATPTGTGNLSGDPAFWSSQTKDYQLMSMSRCIDAGDPASPLDPDGTRADMGAYPFDASYIPAPFVYCTPKPNSCGQLPAIAFVGAPHASATSGFTISTTGAREGKPGLLLYSGVGPGQAPFSGGTLCLAAQSVRRGPTILASGGSGCAACDAVLSIDWAAFATGQLGGTSHPVLTTVGHRINVQWWGRDDQANGSLLSAGIQYGIAP